jgi:DNA-binding NarL/FixJ family response regulator
MATDSKEREQREAAGWLFLRPEQVPDGWHDRAQPAAFVPLLPAEVDGLLATRVTAQIDLAEEQLLKLTACGLSNADIAQRLSLSQRTVERRLKRLQTRLGASSKKELTRLLLSKGFAG